MAHNVTVIQEKREERDREREREKIETWNGMPSIFYGLIPSVHENLFNQQMIHTQNIKT